MISFSKGSRSIKKTVEQTICRDTTKWVSCQDYLSRSNAWWMDILKWIVCLTKQPCHKLENEHYWRYLKKILQRRWSNKKCLNNDKLSTEWGRRWQWIKITRIEKLRKVDGYCWGCSMIHPWSPWFYLYVIQSRFGQTEAWDDSNTTNGDGEDAWKKVSVHVKERR